MVRVASRYMASLTASSSLPKVPRPSTTTTTRRPSFLLFASFSLLLPTSSFTSVALPTAALSTSATPPAFVFRHWRHRRRNTNRSYQRDQTSMTSNQKSATTAVGDFEGISSAAKRDSPSAQRNKEPIWNVLSSKVLPVITGNSSNNDNNSPIRVLEVAAGSGVHAHYFALHMSQNNQYHQPVCFEWYPTDPDLVCRNSIQAHIDDEPTTRLKGLLQSPVELLLDENGIIATEDNETVRKTTFHLMTCINMIHISPWTATEGLMKVAGEQLVKGGILYLYGPYKVGGTSAESNLNFDENLKSRDPSWGVRDLETVIAEAEKRGLVHLETIEMPANNLSVLLQKK